MNVYVDREQRKVFLHNNKYYVNAKFIIMDDDGIEEVRYKSLLVSEELSESWEEVERKALEAIDAYEELLTEA
jgi:hypothetical protein